MANNMMTEGNRLGVSGIPGCLEFATMILKANHTAKTEKEDLQAIWLDLPDSYRSVLRQLM